MSNYDLNYQLYCINRAEDSRGVSLSSNLIKAMKEVGIGEDIWDVTWKDNTFSVRPFLCSALSFMHEKRLFDLLCNYAVNSSEDFYTRLSTMKEKDYYSMYSEDENNVFDSILYQFNSQIPCIARYLLGLNNSSIIKKIMAIVLKEFSIVCNRECECIEFFDKDLCNTQAFSYYISFYWVLQKSKKFQYIFLKDVKNLNLKRLLDICCPETSLHYSYISGVISSDELQDSYTIMRNGSIAVTTKELYNLFTDPPTQGYPQDEFLNSFIKCAGCLILNYGYYDFMRAMACSYITLGFFSKSGDNVSRYKNDISNLKDDYAKLEESNKILKKSLRDSKKERNKLNSKVDSLVNKMNTEVYDKRIESLQSEVFSLKKQLSLANSDLSTKKSELAECKHTIRCQIKELKSLTARLDEVSNVDDCFSDNTIKNDELSLYEMCDSLKDKRIGVFGGFDAGCMQEKFKDYGLNIKHVVNDVTFDVGDLDCAVILTTNIQHKTLRLVKSQYNGCFVYVSGTNVENIITSVYNKLVKENMI